MEFRSISSRPEGVKLEAHRTDIEPEGQKLERYTFRLRVCPHCRNESWTKARGSRSTPFLPQKRFVFDTTCWLSKRLGGAGNKGRALEAPDSDQVCGNFRYVLEANIASRRT